MLSRAHRRSRWPLLAAMAAMLAACAGGPPPGESKPEAAAAPTARATTVVRSGYACCNLRFKGEQLSSSNYAELPFIALGTPILIRAIDGARAIVEIEGRQMTLGADLAQADSAAQWLDKMVLAYDPRRKLETFPATVRLAIASGRLSKGMSREQVIMAIGYPNVDAKKGLDAPSWRYWWSGFETFYVHWSRDKLSKIAGHAETVDKLTYK